MGLWCGEGKLYILKRIFKVIEEKNISNVIYGFRIRCEGQGTLGLVVNEIVFRKKLKLLREGQVFLEFKINDDIF